MEGTDAASDGGFDMIVMSVGLSNQIDFRASAFPMQWPWRSMRYPRFWNLDSNEHDNPGDMVRITSA